MVYNMRTDLVLNAITTSWMVNMIKGMCYLLLLCILYMYRYAGMMSYRHCLQAALQHGIASNTNSIQLVSIHM